MHVVNVVWATRQARSRVKSSARNMLADDFTRSGPVNDGGRS